MHVQILLQNHIFFPSSFDFQFTLDLLQSISVMGLLLFFSFFFFIFLVLKMGKRGKTSGSPNLPPGPMKLPIIGNIHNLVGSLPYRGLHQLAKKYGPVMHLQLGELSTVVVSAPETAEIVMKTHDIIFVQRPFVLALHILTYGSKDIAFSHGSYWRQLRKICITELLSAKRVRSFQSVREEEVRNFVKSISLSAGSPINLSEKIFSMTYGITARATFGGICKQQEEFIACMEESVKLAGGFGPADFFPSIKLFHVLCGISHKIKKLQHRTDRVLDSILSEHKANSEASRRVKEQTNDLVDVLLNVQEHGQTT